ncbi:ATP-binding protein [Accumulibacter sp.]|uniref:ATP-binding protein n=1 Tax=Accumulibacter sp. TaxID=2053492 RepID=UPI0025DD8F4C|nr:ATP-binding protein [Accumulibacter sp.]MCM8613735.1 CHASE domain-containing protein [Accumulibacter sp.]MCM8637369.1 CHASE domain-containing protein [Accumulibacter sp.]MCM8640915.1 CHASE domain-containing protein [Accumulibacter sp.]
MFDNLRKYAAAYLVAAGGLLLTCFSSWNVRQELQTSHFKEFEWAAGDRIQSVRAVTEQGLDALLEIRGLFYAAQGIDEKEFLLFTDSVLKRHPYIEGLIWAPLLTSSRQEVPGTAPGALPARGVRGVAAAAAGEQPRVPVLLTASRGAPIAMPGVDLNATDELSELFRRARASGKVAVSGRMRLDRGDGRAAHVIYAALPVHAPGQPRRAADAEPADPLGFVVGVYDIEELVHVAISLLEPRGVEVLVVDASAEGEARFLHFYASRLEPRTVAAASGLLPEADEGQPRMVVTMPVGDRQWTVTCVATHTFRSAEAFTKAHWSVLLGGLVCTALLVLYLVRSRREMDNRIRLTQTIYEHEELFRQLAETVDVVFWAISPDAARLEYIGPAFRSIAGQPIGLDEPTPAVLFDVFAADDRARLVAAVDQLRREGGHFSIVLPLAGGDPASRWLRVCGFPVHERGVELVRIVGFLEDITEHKLAEDALRDSEARLRTLFNHSPDLIFTVDGEANILLSNRPWPHPAGAAGEKRSSLILPPEVRPEYLQRLRRVFASGRIEHLQYLATGDTWWEVRMVPISTATTVKAAMVVISDITENRKLQWQAIRSSRLASLGVLSAGIAHEINNPNHAILANAGVLARIWNDALPILDEYEQEQGAFMLGGLGFPQARQTIVRGMSDIAGNAKRIQKIVDNLKHLGKQDRGHMDEPADVGRILLAVATLLDTRIRKCTDHFALDLPDSLPLVRGNVQQLEQVFINIIVNALESLPERSRSVRVSARAIPAEGRLVVEVADQGKGIPEDVMAQLGEPFFTTKAESGGTGLGLSISSSIVDRHGGMMRFESNADLGTTVRVDLPIATEE